MKRIALLGFADVTAHSCIIVEGTNSTMTGLSKV
jgi:hypothetical protein